MKKNKKKDKKDNFGEEEDFCEFERKANFNELEKMGESVIRARLALGHYRGDFLRQISQYIKVKDQERLNREKLLRNIAIIIAIATSISAVMIVFSATGG